jgi:hypothetical protein
LKSFGLSRVGALLVMCALPLARPSYAQTTATDPVSNARMHLGPLGVTPSIALTNVGIDSNVFNTVEDPSHDFTLTVSPRLDTWLRAGRSRTSLSGQTDLVYFQKYSSERSIDGAGAVRFELPTTHLTPWVEADYSKQRQRVGYEIDLRSRRVVTNEAIGVNTRVTSKTRFDLGVRRAQYRYDADAFFLGSNLRETLNRHSDVGQLQYRQAVTVLTTLVVEAEVVQDRFDFSSQRDADSIRLSAGLDLDPFALISGRVRVGYRDFRSVSGRMPPYSGVVASLGTGFTLKGRTRLELNGDRDVNYSYEFDYPYYVQTGGILTATPRLTNAWDVQLRVGGQRLAYVTQDPTALKERLDRVVLFGGGIGYRLGRDTRMGLNVDRQRRASPVQRRDYDGYRVGMSVTYGR